MLDALMGQDSLDILAILDVMMGLTQVLLAVGLILLTQGTLLICGLVRMALVHVWVLVWMGMRTDHGLDVIHSVERSDTRWNPMKPRHKMEGKKMFILDGQKRQRFRSTLYLL